MVDCLANGCTTLKKKELSFIVHSFNALLFQHFYVGKWVYLCYFDPWDP